MSELLIITVGYAASLLVTFGFGLFVLSRSARRPEHVAFFLMCIALAGFQLSFILGVNTSDSGAAYLFWFANIIDVFLAIFYLHFIILALDVYARFRRILFAVYAVGLLVFLAAFVFPHSFLPEVAPKLYLKSYLVGGPLYLVMLAFFLASFCISFAVMFLERASRGEEGKRRIDYYIFSLFFGFATGVTAFPLVFGIPLDPIPSVLLGTFVIPMVYGMIKKDLLDIRIVFQRTIFFTFAVAGIAGVLVAVSLLGQLLAPVIPGFNYLVVPVLAGLAAVTVGAIYWRKAGEAERLKYEFITVAAHKFRTPLTRIRWASDELLSREDLPEDVHELLRHVNEADLELIQLSNLLMDAASTEKESYRTVAAEVALAPLVERVIGSYRTAVKEKDITLSFSAPPDLPSILGDDGRLSSAVSVLVENAIAYTPKGGSVDIKLYTDRDSVRFSIHDTGIGVAPDEAPYIFKKFFRTERARTSDTEGIGIGLYMAKNIIERARGSIGVHSAGVGKGSTFWFTLPITKR